MIFSPNFKVNNLIKCQIISIQIMNLTGKIVAILKILDE
ncbi:hypothetical protein CHRYSEO8AT_180108 [Chryseobacterium sp. 8AT]|nr:hypothetical protein CHRYSEO8AT_180108 [Chryseobacterium sp. 8AT]